jgi:methyltransferase (TIGR00027 family)
MAERRIEHKASRTASYTCFSRACACAESDKRFRGPDDMAQIFLPLGAKLLMNVTALRSFVMRKLAAPGIYEYVMARTKLLDEIFLNALENRFPQIVLLGAGFDTRALRFQRNNLGTRVFELDIPATQQPKIEILKRKRVSLPRELVFVPIDFDKQSLQVVLTDAGYQEKLRNLFIWEGVTMYLSAQAVDNTLDFIRRSSTDGSLVAFDYIYASVLRLENKFYGEKGAFDMVSRTGEGWTFGIEEGGIEQFLAQRGFMVVNHYTASDLERRYLMVDDGVCFGRINGTHNFVITSPAY